MKRPFLFVALLGIVSASCGPTTPAKILDTPTPQAGTLVVDPGMDLGPISPYIYGSNYGPSNAVPVNMIQTAFDSHVTVLRFPGGRWGNENDIYPSQIDTFIALCKKMGAIPTISVRFQNSTPETAAALVQYANIEQGYGITYWSIGNEPDYELLNGKKFDTVYFNGQWRAIALAMKAVDPTIKLMGPELSQWSMELAKTPKFPPTKTPTSLERQDWMTDFLRANGDLVDIVTVHRYPVYALTSRTPITADTLRQNTLEWDPMVTYMRDLIQQITSRDLPIAFTEVNSDPDPMLGQEASPDSFYNAIWYADVLGRLISKHVFMVNQFELSNRRGALGLIFNSELRPTYYVFQMYSHFGNELVYSSSGVDFVTVYAAKRTDGTLTLMVINLTDFEQRIPLQIKGKTSKQAEVWLFDATHKAEDLGLQAMPANGAVVLPARSITLYALSK
jgi:alpha-L-arabinofuranosidase